MATHPKTAKGGKSDGTSPLYFTVIRAINEGHWTHAALANAMKQHMSGEPLKLFLTRMHREVGLINSKRGGWCLSLKGMEFLPKCTLQPMTPYKVPPMPPRRPGSNHSHIPSIAGGRELEYRQHV